MTDRFFRSQYRKALVVKYLPILLTLPASLFGPIGDSARESYSTGPYIKIGHFYLVKYTSHFTYINVDTYE